MKRYSMWLVVFLVFLWATPLLARGSGRNIILVHGAWHGAWAWHNSAALLESSGYTVYVPELPGHGIDSTPPASVTLDDYVSTVVAVLDSLAEPAVLVGHSMGGLVISQVAEVRPDLVEKLVYLAAFMPGNGESMFDWAMQDQGSLALSNAIIDPSAGIIDINRDNIEDIFYGESSRQYTILARSLLRPNPMAPIMTPLMLTSANYGTVPRYYITTTNDFAVTLHLQEEMIREQPCTKVYRLESDHSPFFSHPKRLHAILNRIMRERVSNGHHSRH